MYRRKFHRLKFSIYDAMSILITFPNSEGFWSFGVWNFGLRMFNLYFLLSLHGSRVDTKKASYKTAKDTKIGIVKVTNNRHTRNKLACT